MEIVKTTKQRTMSTLESDHSEAVVEFTEDIFSSESTTDGLTKRNETDPTSDTLNDAVILSEVILRQEINLNAPDSMKEDVSSGARILATHRNEISGSADSIVPLTLNCTLANGTMRPINIFAEHLKEINIEVKNCHWVIAGDNTTAIIHKPCECMKHPPCDRAVESDGPNGIDPSFPQSRNFDQGKQHSKRKTRKKVRMESETKISADTRAKVRKRLHSSRFRMATTELVRELDSLERGFHENLLRGWCQSVISYLFGECLHQENYERIKTLLGSAKEAIVAEEDVEKCIENLLTVLQLSGDDLIEASVLTTEVRFVLSVFYAIRGKQKLAMEQLTMIQWSSCLEEQKGRIHLQIAETSARIAQECMCGQGDSKSREVLEVEAKKHFEEALVNCSDEMLSRRDQRATKYACHIGMAKLLLRSDEPLISEGPRPSIENLQKAATHILHLENRSVDLSPVRSSQFFLLQAYFQYFNNNYDCAHAYAIKAKGLAEQCNLEREHELADGAISVLSQNLHQKYSETDDIPLLFTAFVQSYRDSESSSAGNESDPQDCKEEMNLMDSDSDF